MLVVLDVRVGSFLAAAVWEDASMEVRTPVRIACKVPVPVQVVRRTKTVCGDDCVWRRHRLYSYRLLQVRTGTM